MKSRVWVPSPKIGSGAPAGFRNYYRRNAAGAFETLLDSGDLLHTTLAADQFELRLVAATSDLSHVIVSSCAALSADIPANSTTARNAPLTKIFIESPSLLKLRHANCLSCRGTHGAVKVQV